MNLCILHSQRWLKTKTCDNTTSKHIHVVFRWETGNLIKSVDILCKGNSQFYVSSYILLRTNFCNILIHFIVATWIYLYITCSLYKDHMQGKLWSIEHIKNRVQFRYVWIGLSAILYYIFDDILWYLLDYISLFYIFLQ